MKSALLLLASVCLVLLAHQGVLHAQVQGQVTEEAVKAAFLHRFTDFVEWPEKARTKEGYVIGVLSAEGVEGELNRYVATRKSPIAVRRINSIEDVAGVHLLFIGERENARLSKLIAALQHLPVLIVTEAPDGLDRGGMVNFVTTDRVQFEVAIANAARAGIHLNARLLSVAIRVRKGEIEPFLEDILVAGRSTELRLRRDWRSAALAVQRLAWQAVATAAASTRSQAGSSAQGSGNFYRIRSSLRG